MMNTFIWEGPKPKTGFAPKFKAPIYLAKDGSDDFVERLTNYVLDVENNIIAQEALVSEVPKPKIDPYRHTQQWKQHNLLCDFAGLEGEHLKRFPPDQVITELYNLIRTNYLVHLANLRLPRLKAYIHCWANVLQSTEYISKHNHMFHDNSYLSGTYYLTTNKSNLYIENPTNGRDGLTVPTEQKKLIFFPSYLVHYSDPCQDDETHRISIAFDIVLEDIVAGNPYRPHMLFDDPDTMPGLDGK